MNSCKKPRLPVAALLEVIEQFRGRAQARPTGTNDLVGFDHRRQVATIAAPSTPLARLTTPPEKTLR